MSGLDYRGPTREEIAAALEFVLAQPREHKHDPRDEFEPDVDQGYDFNGEGADRLEARETAQRNWSAR